MQSIANNQDQILHTREMSLPGGFSEAAVAGDDVVEAFLEEDHVEGGAQAVEHLAGRGVRPVGAGLVEFEVVAPVEEHARRFGVLGGFQRLRACAHNPKPGGQRQRFLGARQGHVHLPLVHPEINGANGRDAVHQQQCRVIRLICTSSLTENQTLTLPSPKP
jgi:hypothetical protein